MEKADWECWKKLEERFERIHETYIFDSDDDNQDKASQDERIRQKWNVGPPQHVKESDMSPLSPSPSPQQRRSHTNEISDQKKRSKRRREKKCVRIIV